MSKSQNNPFEQAFENSSVDFQNITESQQPPNHNNKIDISSSAINRIKELQKIEGNTNLMLRIKVSGGGCSGFQYIYSFEDIINDDDILFTKDEVTVICDKTSLEYLDGSVIDFVTELVGSAFRIVNPKASSSCGCGTSFSI